MFRKDAYRGVLHVEEGTSEASKLGIGEDLFGLGVVHDGWVVLYAVCDDGM